MLSKRAAIRWASRVVQRPRISPFMIGSSTSPMTKGILGRSNSHCRVVTFSADLIAASRSMFVFARLSTSPGMGVSGRRYRGRRNVLISSTTIIARAMSSQYWPPQSEAFTFWAARQLVSAPDQSPLPRAVTALATCALAPASAPRFAATGLTSLLDEQATTTTATTKAQTRPFATGTDRASKRRISFSPSLG